MILKPNGWYFILTENTVHFHKTMLLHWPDVVSGFLTDPLTEVEQYFISVEFHSDIKKINTFNISLLLFIFSYSDFRLNLTCSFNSTLPWLSYSAMQKHWTLNKQVVGALGNITSWSYKSVGALSFYRTLHVSLVVKNTVNYYYYYYYIIDIHVWEMGNILHLSELTNVWVS